MRPIQWHLKNNWRVSRITAKGDPSPQVPAPPFTMAAEGRQCTYRPTITSNKHALQIFTDASIEGWGAHLDEHLARATWSPPRSKLHINYLELKAVLSGLKRVPRPLLNKIVPIATDNTTVVSYINKEGGMRSCPLCALLWRILTWCTRKQVTKARHIPGRPNVVADKLSRLGLTIQTVVSPSRGLPLYAAGGTGPNRLICHEVQQQVACVGVTSTGYPLATAVDVLSRPW